MRAWASFAPRSSTSSQERTGSWKVFECHSTRAAERNPHEDSNPKLTRSSRPVDGGDFGLIHADVLRENVLVDGDRVSLIDFDDSGHGFRLHDLGTVLSQNLYEPGLPDIARALIAGYATLRPADPELVAVFTMARTLASVGWTMPRLGPDDPVHRSHINRACTP